MQTRVDFYEDARGEHRWRLVAGNGEIVATGEGHASADDARRAWWTAGATFLEAIAERLRDE